MAINSIYPATSPYYNTGVTNDKFLDFLVYRPIPMLPSDVYIVLTETYQYRPDLLAFDLYGDARLWWVFAERNPNRLGFDPYFDFVAGLGIYVPKLETLKQTLGL